MKYKFKNILGILVIFLMLHSCKYTNQLKTDKTLAEKIENEFIKQSDTINLSNLNNFEWDSMIIIGPYSEVEQVETELNLNLRNIRGNGIKYDDRINLMLFLKDKKSIRIAELSREIGDFVISRKIIERGKAKFHKTEMGQNKLMEN